MVDFEQRYQPKDPFKVALEGFDNGDKVTLIGELTDRTPNRHFLIELLERTRERFGDEKVALGLGQDVSSQRFLDAISEGRGIPKSFRKEVLEGNPYVVDLDTPSWANQAYLELLEYCSDNRVRLKACDKRGKSPATADISLASSLKTLVDEGYWTIGFFGLHYIEKEGETSLRRLLTNRDANLRVWSVALLDIDIRPESGILSKYPHLLRHLEENVSLRTQHFGLFDPRSPFTVVDAVVYLPWGKKEIPKFER